MCSGQKKLLEVEFLLHHVGPRECNQVFRLGGTYINYCTIWLFNNNKKKSLEFSTKYAFSHNANLDCRNSHMCSLLFGYHLYNSPICFCIFYHNYGDYHIIMELLILDI